MYVCMYVLTGYTGYAFTRILIMLILILNDQNSLIEESRMYLSKEILKACGLMDYR